MNVTWHGTPSSSNVEAVAQDDRTLYVRYKGGAVYRYSDVSLSALDGLLAAEEDPLGSVGRTLHEVVRGLSYEKVTPE